MEVESLPYVTLVLTLLFLFMVVRIVKRTNTNKSTLKLPPGPWKLPVIGNMHQLISPFPHHKLRDLAKKYGALMQLQLGEVPTVVVSSAEIAKEVMKTNDITFSQRPYLLGAEVMSYDFKDIIFARHGNFWRQMRKICTMELLSPNRVQSFQSIREKEVSNLIKSIASKEGYPINLTEKIFALLYGITARAAFGKKTKSEEEFSRIMVESGELSGGFCLADMYPSSEILKVISGMRIKLRKLHKASDRILENIVNEHKEKRNKMMIDKEQAGEVEVEANDLIDVLLKLQQQGELEFPLTNEHIKAVLQDIFVAGSDTSATTIEWAMSEMLRNQELIKKAQNEVREVFGEKGEVNEKRIHELKFLRSIVKETLRLHPPAPLLVPRECDADCVINGYEIHAKAKVLINAWAIQRDPCYWEEAEEFRPERFLDSSIDFEGTNFQYIPFGGGRRICPGISFGLPIIELTLANLLYHFDWKIANGMEYENLDMTESFGVVVRRKNDLVLIATPCVELH